MWTYLACGIILLLFARNRFKNKIFYPSVIFCFMWGMNCIFHFLIYQGYVNPLVPVSEFKYQYMDTYILFFSAASLVGFSLAHKIYGNLDINVDFSIEHVENILHQYKWVLWLNFFGGVLRFIAIISLIGFSFSNIIAYRVFANSMMMSSHGSFAGWVFRLTAYINMLAIMYVAFSGFVAGIGSLRMKQVLTIFILYAPVQMATGGRLFILYFIIFYFGSFLLGRGISINNEERNWLESFEKRAIINMMIIMLPMVVAISLARGEGGVKNISSYQGSYLDSFSYICDGTMVADKCMSFYKGGDKLMPSYGSNTVLGTSQAARQFVAYKHLTVYASSVYSVIMPIFLDFGFWGSIFIWALIAFLIESIAIKSLTKLTIIRFMIFVLLLKMMYESVIMNPFAGNIVFLELIIIIFVFYNHIFGKYDNAR